MIGAIITLGFGSFAGVQYVPTIGFTPGAAVVINHPVPRRIYELAGPSLGPYELIGPDKRAEVLE